MNKLKLQLLLAEFLSTSAVLAVILSVSIGGPSIVAKVINRPFLASYFITHVVLASLFVLNNGLKTLRSQFKIINALTDTKITVDLANEPAEELTPVQRPVVGSN